MILLHFVNYSDVTLVIQTIILTQTWLTVKTHSKFTQTVRIFHLFRALLVAYYGIFTSDHLGWKGSCFPLKKNKEKNFPAKILR